MELYHGSRDMEEVNDFSPLRPSVCRVYRAFRDVPGLWTSDIKSGAKIFSELYEEPEDDDLFGKHIGNGPLYTLHVPDDVEVVEVPRNDNHDEYNAAIKVALEQNPKLLKVWAYGSPEFVILDSALITITDVESGVLFE